MGSAISLLLTLVIFYLGSSYFVLYNYSLQFIMLCLVLFVTVASTNNNIITSILLLLFGHLLGKVGTDSLTGQQFATFGNPYLIGGIPIVPVMVFLYSLPMIMNLQLPSVLPKLNKMTYEFILPLYTVIRSSIIGFICGFIPQLGSVVASNLAYSAEKLINRKTYDKTGDIKSLAASDSAHNAAIVASLIPLFCFAVPIVPSEGILYEITRSGGLNYSIDWLLQNYWWLVSLFAFANIVGVTTTWPLAKYFVNFIARNIKNFKLLISIALLLIVFQMALSENSLIYYTVLSMVFIPVGYALRRFDLTPLLVGFILAEQFDNVARVAYNLYLKG
jgi:putative tricarboxylic transport membrane protein